MTTEPQPADLLAPLLALVELSKKATPGELEAVLAEGIPCVGTVLADESGGKGFIIGEGWSMEDCEFAAAACNFIRKHEHDLLESLAAQRSEDNGNLTLLDRVEFALRDAGFDYDEAFRCAYLAEYGIDPRSHPPQAQAGAGDADTTWLVAKAIWNSQKNSILRPGQDSTAAWEKRKGSYYIDAQCVLAALEASREPE